MIQLRFCSIEYLEWGCLTRFPDGSEVPAIPHYENPHYHVISHRCGYGDDLLRYCREHEVAHSFLAEALLNGPSRVLWALAHKRTPRPGMALLEEMGTQQFQRWVRANERPILSGADWDDLRRRFLEALNDA